MAPNERKNEAYENILINPAIQVDASVHKSAQGTASVSRDEAELLLAKELDKKSDVNGVTSVNEDSGDWTDVKHSDRKKRDRILPDGVVMKLMKKSDYYGFKRLLSNMALLFLNAYAIKVLDVYSYDSIVNFDWRSLDVDFFTSNPERVQKLLLFLPLYIFYGFQMQCFAFAGGHELVHGNPFKTKWINNVVTFVVGTAFFEVLRHERLMHKQHHTYTLNIDKDPELTSFFSRAELEDPKFKIVPSSRYSYFKSCVNVTSYFRHRFMRLMSSSLGIATDYTGIGWSMKTRREDIDKSVLKDLQFWCLLQVTVYIVIFSTFGNSKEKLSNLLFWWIAPCIIGYGPINFFRNAEHADCDFTNNQLHNTRSVESNRFIRWLLWETNFHAEHHTYPMVPFFNLPVLHEMMKDHIKHNECKTFVAQNWQMVKGGGWIDEQRGAVCSE
eukprot:CAMPEP_0203693104 /NCGR_PEP_ID=MMETSP0091-20130426/5131_1 /ASSEMBLY_ACC=CAM_ASM_001089 /TAXON_ID=426623 /ORGANISM="Chaetoceros affinis, Strain CCMP159" /LENGTH=441 /DNA_ID=CAMNT_0050564111 /DNA_START=68 /DNA_END=1393 /DNA_ORIENTATION=-